MIRYSRSNHCFCFVIGNFIGRIYYDLLSVYIRKISMVRRSRLDINKLINDNEQSFIKIYILGYNSDNHM